MSIVEKGSLENWFASQDAAVTKNRSEVVAIYPWLDEAISLITEIQMFVNTDPIVQISRAEQQNDNHADYPAANLVVNLVNDAMGSLVCATRLMLFGAFPDSFALIRSAFEACCYAEYFAIEPSAATAYMELEPLLNKNPEMNLQKELQRRDLLMSNVRRRLQEKDGENRDGFYARLCNLGAHPSPMRVGLRLSLTGGAILAAYSWSTPEINRAWLSQGCARSIAVVTKYALELLFERYPAWFEDAHSLHQQRESLVERYHQL